MTTKPKLKPEPRQTTIPATDANTGQSATKRSIFNGFSGFVIYIMVILAIAVSLPKALSWALGTPYPIAAITSQSMWPALKKGDLVFVKQIDRDKLKKGDIIVYSQERSFIIHRVIEKNVNSVIAKGDASIEQDQPVTYDQIL